jgi:phosphotriesterase-related protein
MPELITTLGPLQADQLGEILPHEHVFVDLRTWDQPGYAQAEASQVIDLMGPEIEKAKAVGITAIVECSPVGVGRRSDLLKAVSVATNFPLVVPTGIYREPWVPAWAHAASEEKLQEWMLSELNGEIESSGVQAGWIKLSAGDDGLTATETKILKAAAQAAITCDAVIGSHTIRGWVVRDQLDILEENGDSPARFIWIHAQVEPDFTINLEVARRGAWIEYDSIGSDPEGDEAILRRILGMLEAGMANQILLSHDRGWYDPAQPGGGEPRPFTYLNEVFLPRLRAAGIEEHTIQQLTQGNPFRAFARQGLALG